MTYSNKKANLYVLLQTITQENHQYKQQSPICQPSKYSEPHLAQLILEDQKCLSSHM